MSEAKHLVFVSYAAEDKTVADAVCAAIESVGVPCWIAPRDIVTGSNWAKSIMQGISNSKLMVLIFSKQTNASPHVRREIERAVHHDVPIAPLRVEDILPEEDLEYFLSSQHWSDLFPGPVEQRIREIPDKVCRLLGVTPVAPKPPPPLPTRETLAPVAIRDPEPKPADRAPIVAPAPAPTSKPPPLPIPPTQAAPAPTPPPSPAPVQLDSAMKLPHSMDFFIHHGEHGDHGGDDWPLPLRVLRVLRGEFVSPLLKAKAARQADRLSHPTRR